MYVSGNRQEFNGCTIMGPNAIRNLQSVMELAELPILIGDFIKA